MADRSRQLAKAVAAALVLLEASATRATPATENKQIFPAEYFASARPADAYDMIRKLPGFDLIEGDEDVRGFSGSRGNVLFDGRPPAGKDETLEQALKRIPASSVLRIELIRGGSKSSATGSYDLVANIVRARVAATTMAVTTGLSAATRVGVKPDARIELTRDAGDRRFDGALSISTDIDDDSGAGPVFERDAGGQIVGDEHRDLREVTRTLAANGEYKFPLGSGELIANANISRDKKYERIWTSQDGDRSLAAQNERSLELEAGSQFRSSLAGGNIELLAVQRIGRLDVDAVEEDEDFGEATRTRETIARMEYRRGSEPFSYFGSVEAALNRLTSDTSLKVGGVEVPVSGSDVAVSERRVEAALGAIWSPSDAVVVEPTMRVEQSLIRSTGDSPQSERFLFWKPRFKTSWNRGDTRIQLTVEREAAQLDFGDFVASAELGQDDIVAGATSLRPPVTWSISGTAEQRFWGDGAIQLTVRQEWIDDVIDRVVVNSEGELFDAVGNIGKATRRIIQGDLTLPLSRIGIAGAQLRSTITLLKSRVIDPVTGRRRPISKDRPLEGEVRFIHDIPGGKWSWGLEASLAHHESEFRFDEIRDEHKGASFGGYVEFRPAAEWRIRLEADNLSRRHLIERKREFDGSRATGEIDSTETRRLRTSPIFAFSVRRSFGGSKPQAGSRLK